MALVTNRSIKLIVFIICLMILSAGAEKTKKDETLKCVRWRWTGDVYERKVYCIEWVKKDCSNRLHKEICKLE
jgi:hypothetical protein